MQKLHDFLAHSSEESEETSSPPRPVMNQSTGKLGNNVQHLLVHFPIRFGKEQLLKGLFSPTERSV